MNLKKNTTLAALAAGFLITASAHAKLIPIDDFSVPHATVKDTTLQTVPKVSGSGTQEISDGGVSTIVNNVNPIISSIHRTLTHELLATPFPVNAATPFNYKPTAFAEVVQPGGGYLQVINGAGENSTVSVSWNVAADFVPENTSAQFQFFVNNTDSNPTFIDFYFGDGSTSPLQLISGHNTLGANLLNADVFFNLSFDSIAKINKGGIMTMVMNGSNGWDMNIDTYGINYIPVPEANLMGLIALGLVGFDLTRKRTASLLNSSQFAI